MNIDPVELAIRRDEMYEGYEQDDIATERYERYCNRVALRVGYPPVLGSTKRKSWSVKRKKKW